MGKGKPYKKYEFKKERKTMLVKSRTKKLMALLLSAALMASVAGCGGGDAKKSGDTKAAGGAASGEKFTLSWAHGSSPEDRLGKASENFKKNIEKKSGGRITINHYPANQLGSEREVMEGVSLGSIDCGVISSAVVAGFSKSVNVTNLPYMLDNREKAWKIYDGEFGKKLGALTEKEGGWKWLGWAENSLRMFSNAKKEIKTPADMVGLKIRTQENDIHMKIVNDLGASATPIAFGELYTALQQGTVDGQENGVALTYSMGFAEIVKYMTLLPHIYDPYIVAISKESWNKLPPDLQKIFQECVNDFIKDERNLNAQNDKEYLEIMKKKNGLKTYTPTAEEAKLFKDATKNIEPMVRAKAGDEIVNDFIKAAK